VVRAGAAAASPRVATVVVDIPLVAVRCRLERFEGVEASGVKEVRAAGDHL